MRTHFDYHGIFYGRHESGLSSSFEERLTLDDIQPDQIKLNAVGKKIEETEPIFPKDLANKGEFQNPILLKCEELS